MKITYLIIFIILNSFCSTLIAQSIVVVNIQLLIDKNPNYLASLESLEKSQKKYLNDFKEQENKLKKMLEDIETSKLILNENEINTQIESYNKQLNEFSILVEEFNFHYQNQIIEMRESLLKEIISLLEYYAISNKIDLILDSTSYLIASNTIDITEDIKKKLDEININLEYRDFEKN